MSGYSNLSGHHSNRIQFQMCRNLNQPSAVNRFIQVEAKFINVLNQWHLVKSYVVHDIYSILHLGVRCIWPVSRPRPFSRRETDPETLLIGSSGPQIDFPVQPYEPASLTLWYLEQAFCRNTRFSVDTIYLPCYLVKRGCGTHLRKSEDL